MLWRPAKNAYEQRDHYGKDGKLIMRERIVGPMVPRYVVAGSRGARGRHRTSLTAPTTFWHLIQAVTSPPSPSSSRRFSA